MSAGIDLAGLRLLVLDDEPGYRRLLTGFLQDLGMAVASTGDAAEAVALAKTHRPAVVVADLMLGDGVDGPEVFAALTAHVPGCALVLASGCGSAELTRAADRLPRAVALPKPYCPEQLRDAIVRALASASPG